MAKFNVGDRIVCVYFGPDKVPTGDPDDILEKVGTLVEVPETDYTYYVAKMDTVVGDTDMWHFLEDEIAGVE